MKLKFYLEILLTLLAMIAADHAFAIFCPSNFSQISMGDTMQSVVETCGKPDAQKTYIKSVYRSEELVYFVKTNPFVANTSKLNIVVDNGQVINITITENSKVCQQPVQGGAASSAQNPMCQMTQETKSVGSTNLCGVPISVGESAQVVQSACGQPSFVNHGQQADAQNTYTELRYNGPPSVSLVFENGLLVDRVQN